MMNSIRLYPLASPLFQGEAQNRKPTREGQGDFGDPCGVQTVSVAEGMDGVVGDGMAGSWSDVNQGSRAGNSDGVHGLENRPEEPCPEGDRALVGAEKRGHARGAKGGREVECERVEEAVKDWRSAERLFAPEAEKPPFPKKQSTASEPQGATRRPSCTGVSPFRGLKTTILESRMREIRPSGLGGGVEGNTSTPTLSIAIPFINSSKTGLIFVPF
jgi:hypothetical protein